MRDTTRPDDLSTDPKASILLVDDQPANLLALEAILADLGQNLVTARSGAEALRRLLDEDFAVVLLDIQMQGPDGFDTAQLIRGRERSRHTPIIFLTAHESALFPAAKAYTLGAVDYLVKPLVPTILRAKVAVFVELFQKTEQLRRQAERLRQAERREFEQRLAEENARLRQSEARFRALVQNAWDGISLVGPDGTILENLPDNLGNLGYKPEEFVGHCGLDFIHPDDVPAVQRLLGQLLQVPGSRATAHYRLRARDGSWRWMEATATSLVHDPAVGAIVVNYHDVTERKGHEELLHRRAEELAEVNRTKDQFLAMLAHELRNPLSPLAAGLHLLQAPGVAGPVREQALGMMGRQLRHLARLLDDLLDVSRLTRGRVELQPEHLDLARLVRTTAEDRRQSLEQAGLSLTVEVPGTPVRVWGDGTRLVQSLNNLLDNAAKFSNRGGRITVRLAAAPPEGQAVLSVRDAGIGIEPALMPRLFDVFAQADRSLDRSRGGLGLGLSMVKGLVELHGGQVQAASAGPGKGAEFTIRLPLEPSAAETP
jgi:PAS domain S-box-containing protein